MNKYQRLITGGIITANSFYLSVAVQEMVQKPETWSDAEQISVPSSAVSMGVGSNMVGVGDMPIQPPAINWTIKQG